MHNQTYRAIQRQARRRRRQHQRAFIRNPHQVHPKEVWNLDFYAARYLLPRLKGYLRELDSRGSVPAELGFRYPADASERWKEMVRQMINSFDYYANSMRLSKPPCDDELLRVQEGLDLFARWFGCLWI